MGGDQAGQLFSLSVSVRSHSEVALNTEVKSFPPRVQPRVCTRASSPLQGDRYVLKADSPRPFARSFSGFPRRKTKFCGEREMVIAGLL